MDWKRCDINKDVNLNNHNKKDTENTTRYNRGSRDTRGSRDPRGSRDTQGSRDNRYKNNYTSTDRNFERVKRAGELKREEAKNREFNITNFPGLVENIELVDPSLLAPTTSEYLNKINLTIEEDKCNGNDILRDTKNWRDNVWIGPQFIKMDNYSKEREEQLNRYISTASDNASTIIIPCRKTYYSRNNVNWYDSWDKTFSEEELVNMNVQLEREEHEDLNRRMCEGMHELYLKRKKESDQHYYETGELDGLAIAELERANYEKWLEEFEKQMEEEYDEESEEEEFDIY
jgi:hypothetical protein